MTGAADPDERPGGVAALRFRLRNPPGHWKLLGACLVLLGALIAFQGFCTHTSAPVPRRLQISPPARH